jgi:hypothetical protein
MNRLILTTAEARRLHGGTITEIRRPVEGPPRWWSFTPSLVGKETPSGYRTVHASQSTDSRLAGTFPRSIDPRDPRPPFASPLGKPGDLLWTAEEYIIERLEEGLRVVYRADRAAAWLGDEPGKLFYVPSDYEPGGWMPADRMPKVLSRAKGRLTAVRAERTGDTWEWVYSVERSE